MKSMKYLHKVTMAEEDREKMKAFLHAFEDALL